MMTSWKSIWKHVETWKHETNLNWYEMICESVFLLVRISNWSDYWLWTLLDNWMPSLPLWEWDYNILWISLMNWIKFSKKIKLKWFIILRSWVYEVKSKTSTNLLNKWGMDWIEYHLIISFNRCGLFSLNFIFIGKEKRDFMIDHTPEHNRIVLRDGEYIFTRFLLF